jgi:1-acyl-sn-glycerol-3-phosphate acyltransferase
MPDRTELLMLRRSLSAFMRSDSVTIVLTRPQRVDVGNGGWREDDPIVLNPQQFRLVPFKRRLTHLESDTQDGAIPILPYVLIGAHDADVLRDDEFDFRGKQCKVVGVEPSTGTSTDDRVVVEFEMR